MKVALNSSPFLLFPSNSNAPFRNRTVTECPKSTTLNVRPIRNRRPAGRIAAISDVSAATDPAGQVSITWQIVVGAIAGVTPFVVAGIEFSKRIIAQKQCEVCGGSGLILREKDYIRCPGCGGFLPWQSWKRFFTG